MRFAIYLILFATACDGAKDTGPMDDTDDTDTGSTDTGTDLPPDPLAIVGIYTDTFGSSHTITDTSWTIQYGSYTPSLFSITAYDNTTMVVLAQNDDLNSYFPLLWSRFDWLELDEHLYYCQTTYNAASESDAASLPRADGSDPTSSGCGGFPWTDLTP